MTEKVVSNSYQKVTLPAPDSVDIGQTLSDLRLALDDLRLAGGERRQITKSMEAAEQEAKSDNPNKQSIGDHVEKALSIARLAGDFVDVCRQLGPHVAGAASWLGENWYKLLALVGLQV
ncbi:MAG: hypothetical protein ABIE70_01460 [bacterium]